MSFYEGLKILKSELGHVSTRNDERSVKDNMQSVRKVQTKGLDWGSGNG